MHKFILVGSMPVVPRSQASWAEAERCLNEAAALLKSYEDKRKARKEAADRWKPPVPKPSAFEAEAKAKLEDFVKRRTAQAELKICAGRAAGNRRCTQGCR